MGIEGINLPGNDPEQIFKKVWEEKDDNWVKATRLQKLPEDLEAQLTYLIDKFFVEDYLRAEIRDPKKLEMFIIHCLSSIEDAESGQEKAKFDIFNLIKDDLNKLEDIVRLSKEN